MLLARNGFMVATTSSRPMFAENAVSVSEKRMIEPSAPPPLFARFSERNAVTFSAAHVPKLSGRLEGGGERDGVVEREAQRLVGLVAALVEEQVVLQIVANGEQAAARRIGGGIDTVGAGHPPGEGT